MEKRTENKKSLRINTIGVIGPCMAIPVTPKFVACVCRAKDEAEYHSDGPMKDVVTALYNAIMESDEPEQDEKPEPEPYDDGQA